MLVKQGAVAFLTYHRLVAPGVRTVHYDVSLADFERQMEEVSTRVRSVSGPLIQMMDGTHVCLSFDDGTSDHLDGAEVLAGQGLPAVFFIVVDRLESKGYLGRADVRRLAESGHTIGSHSMSHRRLTKLSFEQRRKECERSKAALEDLIGAEVAWFAFPNGDYSLDCFIAAEIAGYKVMRTMEWGYAGFPLEGKVRCWPMFGHRDLAAFRRILDGRARAWPYRIKQGVKTVLPEGAYTRLRDQALVGGR
ncbi:MAG: polysaccharide deacetylase family protein [Proteobacteria bacterium]|nr:polysaccharide deacetylase family protein [Pseudomonadota bacterium]